MLIINHMVESMMDFLEVLKYNLIKLIIKRAEELAQQIEDSMAELLDYNTVKYIIFGHGYLILFFDFEKSFI